MWWGAGACVELNHALARPPTTRVQDVLKFYGATRYGSGPPALGERSPRESYNPEADGFLRERGSYQNQPEHP